MVDMSLIKGSVTTHVHQKKEVRKITRAAIMSRIFMLESSFLCPFSSYSLCVSSFKCYPLLLCLECHVLLVLMAISAVRV